MIPAINRMAVHFSSAKDSWATPQRLFDELNAKYQFTLDVCADAANTKVPYNFYSLENGEDGLSLHWSGRCWMNPPYGREIGKWVKKAYEESQKGVLVVSLLPSRTDTRWFHQYIYAKSGVEIQFLRGRLKFGNAVNSAPFPSMIVVFNKRTTE